MGNNVERGVSVRRLTSKVIEEHKNNTSQSDFNTLKILLFGTNAGKSYWFNHSFDVKPLAGITYKTESINIGDKLPEIKTIIYDTAENTPTDKLDDNLISHIQTNVDGIIFTYNIYDLVSLRNIQKAIPSIISNSLFSSKNVRFLLLGIQEKIIENAKEEENLCIDEAQQFAAYCNLFHLQLNITTFDSLNSMEPYIFILRRILKQKDVEEGDGDDEFDAYDNISRYEESKMDPDEKQEIQEDDNEYTVTENTMMIVHNLIGDFNRYVFHYVF